jgi:hypothetical protein
VQLSDAVSRLGSDLQKQKWVAGLMAHREALDLIYMETFGHIPGAVMGSDFVLPEETDEYDQKIERNSTEKKTLTDTQFAKAREIVALAPGATAAYYHEYYENSDDEENEELPSLDILLLSKKIGEYSISCQIAL